MTPFMKFLEKWRKGCGSCLCAQASRICHVRGSLPCDIAFVGEAPGDSEDTLGVPFKGPAGQLIDRIITRSVPEKYTFALMNLVGCFPLEEKRAGTNAPPSEAIESCTPRLQELLRICNPKLIVAVGALARDWLKPGYKHSIKLHKQIPMIDIDHPARIIRSTYAQRGLMTQRNVVVIANAIEEYLEEGKKPPVVHCPAPERDDDEYNEGRYDDNIPF